MNAIRYALNNINGHQYSSIKASIYEHNGQKHRLDRMYILRHFLLNRFSVSNLALPLAVC